MNCHDVLSMILGDDALKVAKKVSVDILMPIGLYTHCPETNTGTIHIADWEATNPEALIVAAHEAFHAKRHMEDKSLVYNYETYANTLLRSREETIVMAMAVEWCRKNLSKDDGDKATAFARISIEEAKK